MDRLVYIFLFSQWYYSDFVFQATAMQSFSGAIINLILIMLMANVYTVVAEWLTKWGKLSIREKVVMRPRNKQFKFLRV